MLDRVDKPRDRNATPDRLARTLGITRCEAVDFMRRVQYGQISPLCRADIAVRQTKPEA